MKYLFLLLAVLIGMQLAGCKQKQPTIAPKEMADAIHIVLISYRTVYVRDVLNRLVNQDKVITASEQWKEHKALVLPAQMFRLSAEQAQKRESNFSYSLLSLWPIHKRKAPLSALEKEGLDYISQHPNKPFYRVEKIGEENYFTAIYADRAVSKACVTCHNNHKDSPKTDFKLGEAMGGIVIRIKLVQ